MDSCVDNRSCGDVFSSFSQQSRSILPLGISAARNSDFPRGEKKENLPGKCMFLLVGRDNYEDSVESLIFFMKNFKNVVFFANRKTRPSKKHMRACFVGREE